MFNIKIVNKLLDTYCKKCSHLELAKKSVRWSVITSIFLIAIKCIAWIVTDSVSMHASMTDSILDAFTSFIAYHSLIFSETNRDESHNFGHEKVEGLMALFQSVIIIYSGIIICREAYEMFVNPSTVQSSGCGVLVMIISCFAVYQLIYFQKYVMKKTESILVEGDSLHYVSDFLMNICIMVSLALSAYFKYIDAICGLVVGCYVFYNALLILKNAVIDLMDESLPKKSIKKIEGVIMKEPRIKRIKSLRTRSAGMKKYIEACLQGDENLSLKDSYKISQELESELRKIWEKVDVMIRIDPE